MKTLYEVLACLRAQAQGTQAHIGTAFGVLAKNLLTQVAPWRGHFRRMFSVARRTRRVSATMRLLGVAEGVGAYLVLTQAFGGDVGVAADHLACWSRKGTA